MQKGLTDLGKRKGVFHLMAFACIAAWSGSYILSALAMQEQITPVSLFVSRFLTAYLFVWIVSRKQPVWYGKRKELLFFLTGFSGGSLYFVLENTALQITSASNVSVLICFSSMFTLLLMNWKQPGRVCLWGPLFSLTGVVVIVFNNNFIPDFCPVGDLLVLLAALSWSVYGILLKKIEKEVPLPVLLRKLFFYGGISALLPWGVTHDISGQLSLILRPDLLIMVVGLGLISVFCYLLWNMVVRQLGPLVASYYIYLTPVFTFVFSDWILNEIITGMMCIGVCLILWGVWLTEKKQWRLSITR